MQAEPQTRIPVGISECLIGSPVRFNASHKHSRLCTEQLGRLFELTPFCPEVAIGLSTPRQPIRLVGEPEAPRVIGTRNPSLDVTVPLQHYAEQVSQANPQLCGFILMQKSPSCGMERVKVYRDNGHPADAPGSGAFAARLMARNPLLPVEEEGRLHDPVLCENFVTRVIVYAQWQALQSDGISAASLLRFHARHKYLAMAHHQGRYRELGAMLANLRQQDLRTTATAYFARLMHCLKTPAQRGGHCNALQHLAGHFKHVLKPQEKQELRTLIDDYRRGTIPLVVPITLLKHHLLNHPDGYLVDQAYLQPHPAELSLRNAI
ncbi:YbgA family protein [Halopseudomonas sp.]|uniref:YbgA family protein n=1 Tax=Halopseudomonas sp. TaxID=2901191 RepID=UPI003002FBE1